MSRSLMTVGHGTLTADELARLVTGAGVEELVDVRSFPASRRHPQFRREAMEQWLPDAGVSYRWEPRLGGRRRPAPDSPHGALRVAAFRGYADHMETPEFRDALDVLLTEAATRPTAVMCAESLWWRCHRRLLADSVVLVRGTPVEHLFHDARVEAHRPTPEARVDGSRLVYDGDEPALPLGDS
ncbi:MAG TPA: DUF488 domain-containing protein [Acidimicrobiia bacterium]|nr:DUF488 domain-containing protein [Acidimicrobiia bacterium]